MKRITSLHQVIVLILSISLISCEKNYTVFYEDDDAKDLSVFSDMGNNVMSCYIDGHPFRTRDRVYKAGFSRGILYPEIELFKDDSGSDSDTLIINWRADVLAPNPHSVSVVLVIKKDFTYSDFNDFNNTRFVIDGVNGYFMVDDNRSEKGTGSIYFHKAILMPDNTVGVNNQLSGVFEASLPSFQITRGRFDHTLPVGRREGVVFF
ncbi:MAG TPA: hypothetical protein PLL71_10400 [Agriterribacter sp.]|nr:hypothetical protein [Agriterribacter sp.]HRQ49683.1 hypothetical protein [Agriterribacter sp.]